MWLADMFHGTKQNQFFELARRHTAQLVDAAETLEKYVQGGGPELPERIHQIEKSADATLAETIDALTDTFITPYDRQDIFNLAESVDEMIDYLNNAAREIALFNVGFTDAMRTMAAILTRAAHEIQSAVMALNDGTGEAQTHCGNASHAENQMEDFYRRTLAALFDEPDIHRILKLREIYEHFNNSADQADAIARQIGKTVVKTA